MVEGGGLGQRGAAWAASWEVPVAVPGSLFPSHATSPSTLAACVGFTGGRAAAWEVRAGCPFLLRRCACRPRVCTQRAAQKYPIAVTSVSLLAADTCALSVPSLAHVLSGRTCRGLGEERVGAGT